MRWFRLTIWSSQPFCGLRLPSAPLTESLNSLSKGTQQWMQSMHFCVSTYIPVFLPLTLSECLALFPEELSGWEETNLWTGTGWGICRGARALGGGWCLSHSLREYQPPHLPRPCAYHCLYPLAGERESQEASSPQQRALLCGSDQLVYDQPGCPGLLGGCFFPQDWEPGSAPWSGHSLPNSTSAVLTGLPRTVPQRRPHAAVWPGALALHAVAAHQRRGRDQRAAGWTRFCPQMLGLQPRRQCEENPVHHALGRVHRPQISQICPSLAVRDVGLKVLYLWFY